jgi:hypothetical protein
MSETLSGADRAGLRVGENLHPLGSVLMFDEFGNCSSMDGA